MSNYSLSVREIQESDIDLITRYWLGSDAQFLKAMGVDPSKIPGKEEWRTMLMEQIHAPLEEKKSFCIIWQLDNIPSGHSNINKISFGQEAYMHLHLWNNETRRKGVGAALVKMTLPWFFEKYQLKKLYCEPYALNTPPNKTLEKLGFEFIKEYITTPGWINFEQPVKLWQLTYDSYKEKFGV